MYHAFVLHCETVPSRQRYSGVLKEYLLKHRSALSKDSATRLDRGAVLRVLDSKSPADVDILAAAPDIGAHLTSTAASVRC